MIAPESAHRPLVLATVSFTLSFAATFGGFVAFSIYLPTLLRTQFG
jgi:nitrate/nitrite transporter NarK